MKYDNKHIVLVLILALTLLSCKKYLDAKPDNKLTTPDTIENLQAVLDEAEYMNEKTACFDEASADDYFLTPENYNTVGTLNQDAYTWNVTSYLWPNDWSNEYLVVYNANVCLENIENIARTNDNGDAWDNVKGSALVYRASAFLKLAWLYAKAYSDSSADHDLGIPLRLGTDFNKQVVRSSVLETYNQIVKDLMESIAYLPITPQHVMRPSKPAAYGFLARAYLSMNKYDSAWKYADLCLSLKHDLMDYNSIDASSSNPFQNFNKEVIFHTDISTYTFRTFFPGTGYTDSTLYSLYNKNDLRKTIFFIDVNGYQIFKGTYANPFGWNTPLFTGLATDEMYITRAECSIRLNNIETALNDLNTLLSTRFKEGTFFPVKSSSVEQVLELILEERRKELLFRGLRWIDIKRLNNTGEHIKIQRLVNGSSYILLPNDNRFALPLPSDIADQNGIIQNPR